MSTTTTTTLGLGPNLALTIPVISSSLTVFYAIMEPTIFNCFLQSAKPDRAGPTATGKVVRHWWTAFLTPGLTLIFLVTMPGVVGGFYALRHLQQASLKYYLCIAGATFTLGHFAFGPAILDVINNVCDEENEKKGKTLDYVARWNRIHYWRTFLSDLPALICFYWVAFGPDKLS